MPHCSSRSSWPFSHLAWGKQVVCSNVSDMLGGVSSCAALQSTATVRRCSPVATRRKKLSIKTLIATLGSKRASLCTSLKAA
jgi:hypothetical protein